VVYKFDLEYLAQTAKTVRLVSGIAADCPTVNQRLAMVASVFHHSTSLACWCPPQICKQPAGSLQLICLTRSI
jgi:hypothetical protein